MDGTPLTVSQQEQSDTLETVMDNSSGVPNDTSRTAADINLASGDSNGDVVNTNPSASASHPDGNLDSGSQLCPTTLAAELGEHNDRNFVARPACTGPDQTVSKSLCWQSIKHRFMLMLADSQL